MKRSVLRTVTFGLAILGSGLMQAEPWRVSQNRRHLVDANGSPVLYLADTAWELFHRLDRDEATVYLEDRAAKGFTVIQAVVLSELDGLRTPNMYGDLPLIDLDPTRPNEAYFGHVDFVLAEAERLGLQMALLPSWGDKVDSSRAGAGPVIFDPENAASFGEYLGKRYRGRSVIWVPGGDRAVDSEKAYRVWNSLALGLSRGGAGEHLLSFHPVGDGSSADEFHDEEWLDFNLYQSGHSRRFTPVHEFAERHLLLQPRKPFVDGEPAYEDIPIRFWEHMDWDAFPNGAPPELYAEGTAEAVRAYFGDRFFTDYDVRVHAYWNLLSGAAGYAYGNNAVWQMRKYGDSAPIPTLSDWEGALDRPGARQMRHLRSVFESRPFHKLLPDQSLVFGRVADGDDTIRAAIAEDGSFAMAYLAKGQTVRMKLAGFSGDIVEAWWFNPRDGSARSIGTFKTGEVQAFAPPSSGVKNDWLLVLDRQDAFAGAPGLPGAPSKR